MPNLDVSNTVQSWYKGFSQCQPPSASSRAPEHRRGPACDLSSASQTLSDSRTWASTTKVEGILETVAAFKSDLLYLERATLALISTHYPTLILIYINPNLLSINIDLA